MSEPTRRDFHRRCLAAPAAAWLSASAFVAERGAAPARAAASVGRSPIEDFTYLHVSDTHLDPRPVGAAFNPDGRSVHALEWFAQQSGMTIDGEGRQIANGTGADRAPAFAIHTGDVFEYSVVDDCWEDWQRIEQALACPVYCVPGNHDNTWSSINRLLRRQYGADSYSFDHGGCHFACLNTAGSLDPLPCWDERTLRWLSDDLAAVDRATPVLLAFHHPLSGDAGYASEYDKLRFWEIVRGHRVVLMMDGHWHQVRAGTWQNIPRVNGGETFRLNTGYATVSVAGGVLTQRYHFHDTAQGGARDALVLRTRLDAPVPRYSAKLAVEFKSQADRQIRIIGTITAEAIPASNDPAIRVTAWLDGERGAARETHASPGAEPSRGIASETFEVDLNAADLPPGRHYVTVRFESVAEQVHIESEVADGPTPLANEQAVTFELADPAGRYAAVSYQGGAGVKTRLIEVDRDNGAPLLIFGDTAGVVTALDASTMQPRWQYATASEILHALTRVGPHIVAGDTDGNLHVLDARTGAQLHKLSDFAPVFGAGLVVDGALYFGDANGWLHAVDTTTWAKIWSRDVAQFAFESPPVHDSQNDRLLLGSWDGFYYSVSRAAGEVQWKAWNTQGQVAAKSRYYGPADSAPVVVGDEMWGADRGYRLGRYRLIDGEFLGEVHSQVAAIAPVGGPTDAAGEGVVARGQDNRLIRFRPDGSIAWETEAPLGRCPIPPTVAAPPAGRRGNIAAVSDRGLLTLVDAESGEPQLQWSLTPQLFVLAPVTASSDGKAWFAAGMDGVVTRISAVND